jgi:hypothetical protein
VTYPALCQALHCSQRRCYPPVVIRNEHVRVLVDMLKFAARLPRSFLRPLGPSTCKLCDFVAAVVVVSVAVVVVVLACVVPAAAVPVVIAKEEIVVVEVGLAAAVVSVVLVAGDGDAVVVLLFEVHGSLNLDCGCSQW